MKVKGIDLGKYSVKLNTPLMQILAADGFKIALCRLDNKFQELGLDAHLVLTLHDEIAVEARDELADQVSEVVAECLQEAFMGIVPEMPFELEMRIAEASGDEFSETYNGPGL